MKGRIECQSRTFKGGSCFIGLRVETVSSVKATWIVDSWQSDVSHSSLPIFFSLFAIHASCRLSVAASK